MPPLSYSTHSSVPLSSTSLQAPTGPHSPSALGAETLSPVARTRGRRTVHASQPTRPRAKIACDLCRQQRKGCKPGKNLGDKCLLCQEKGENCTWTGQTDQARMPIKQLNSSLEADKELLNKRVDELQEENEQLKRRLDGVEKKLMASGLPIDDPSGSEMLPLDEEDLGITSSLQRLVLSRPDGSYPYNQSNHCSVVPVLRMDNGQIVRASFPTSIPRNVSQVPQRPGMTHEAYRTTYIGSRYLPIEVPLTEAEHNVLLNDFFKYYSCWLIGFDPQSFIREMSESLWAPNEVPASRTGSYSPCLHNVFMFLAIPFSERELLRTPETRQRFLERALEYLSQERAHPSLCVMHALFLLGIYYSGNGESRNAQHYFLTSVEIAHMLGLDLDSSKCVWNESVAESIVLRRSWSLWTVFLQDQMLYLAIQDRFRMSFRFSGDLAFPVIQEQSDPDLRQRANLETCKLFSFVPRIEDFIARRLQTESSTANMCFQNQIQCDLDKFMVGLPSGLLISQVRASSNASTHVIMLNLMYWWFTLRLHMATYEAKYPRSVMRCNQASQHCLALLGVWKRQYQLRFIPNTAIKIAVDTGFAFVSAAIEHSRIAHEAQARNALQCLQTMVIYLKEMGQTWPFAEKGAGILDFHHGLLLNIGGNETRRHMLPLGSTSCAGFSPSTTGSDPTPNWGEFPGAIFGSSPRNVMPSSPHNLLRRPNVRGFNTSSVAGPSSVASHHLSPESSSYASWGTSPVFPSFELQQHAPPYISGDNFMGAPNSSYFVGNPGTASPIAPPATASTSLNGGYYAPLFGQTHTIPRSLDYTLGHFVPSDGSSNHTLTDRAELGTHQRSMDHALYQ